MCLNDHLRILVLDGLHTAESCRTLIFPTLHKSFHALDAYMLTRPIEGSIPSCLFTMPKLKTLHISGNALHGSLPQITTISPSLQDLSLSHNQLTGTISGNLLAHNWASLDLSFNRFTGTISESVSNFSQGSLKLEINRLSGLIPQAIHDAPNINILQGNIFACSGEEKDDLPAHDENIASYVCGSNAVDSSLYAWCGAFILLSLFISLMIVSFKDLNFREWNGLTRQLFALYRFLDVEVSSWWQVYNSRAGAVYFEQPIEHVYEFGAVMKEVRRWCVGIGVVMVTVLLPLYPLLSLAYHTYEHTYAWNLSVAFLSGRVPASIILVVMILFLCGIYSTFGRGQWMNVYNLFERTRRKLVSGKKVRTTADTANRDAGDTSTTPVLGDVTVTIKRTNVGWYSAMVLGGLINIVVVLAVNTSYVIATTGGLLKSDEQQAVSFLVTLFKIFWNGTLMETFQSVLMKLMPAEKVESDGEQAVVSFMIWMNLFNNIIVPCIAVVFVSPDCFYYAFFSAPVVEASFAFRECDGLIYSTNGGSFYCEAEYDAAYVSRYTPPFTYNYQCTSSLLTSFMDIMIYRFVISAFVSPVLLVVFKFFHEEAFIRYGPQSYPYSVAIAMLPDELHALSDNALALRRKKLRLERIREKARVKLEAMEIESDKSEGATETKQENSKDKLEAGDDSVEEEQYPEEGVLEVKFKAKNAIIAFVSDIAVLLTFGGIFPPIAFIGIFSLFSTTLVTQLSLGRVVVLSRTQPALQASVRRINQKCAGVRYLMLRSLLSLSLMLSIFWSFFLFDILGDEVGMERAVWIIGVMVAVPGMIQISNFLIKRYNPSLVLLRDELLSAASAASGSVGVPFPFSGNSEDSDKSAIMRRDENSEFQRTEEDSEQDIELSAMTSPAMEVKNAMHFKK
jgi:ABC-type multidrug transport system fused ATPase/permease subunit